MNRKYYKRINNLDIDLEETLKENPDKEWLEYDGRKWIKEDYVVLKSKVKDKIEEIQEEGYWLFTTDRDSDKCVEVLQKLLEKEQ